MSKGTQVHAVRVPPELWERARAAASKRGEAVSDVIRRALWEYVDLELSREVAQSIARDLVRVIEGFSADE